MAIPILLVVVPLLALFMRKPPEGGKTRGVGDTIATALPGLEVSEAFRSRSFWMIAIAEVFFATAGVGLRVHLVPFLTGVGYSPTLAAEILGAMFVFSAIGSSAIGALADRLGGRATLSRIFFAGAAGVGGRLRAGPFIAGPRLPRTFWLGRRNHPPPRPIPETLASNPPRPPHPLPALVV